MNNEEFDNNELFLNNLNSTLSVKTDYDMKDYDYEWLDIIEDVLPYLDNILRNPKRFIINEEEIVKVELARKVTVESVIHLSQHTNLIQKIEDNGDVKPSKILNINKEENLDTYENRFIYTLINNLRLFFEQRISDTADSSYCLNKNNLKYEANTKINCENIEISLEIKDVSKEVKEFCGSKNGFSFSERIHKIKAQLDGFSCNEMMLTLTRLHVPPVRSPIRKTNVILKNPNFRKAEELWNYIQSFETKDKKVKEKQDYFDKGVLKQEYDQAFLMTFIANKNLISTSASGTESNIINQMIVRLIDNLLNTDASLDEDKIKDIFNKQIQIIKEKNIDKAKTIYNIIDDRLDRENKNYETILKQLRGDA